MEVLILGAGGIGGYLAARLSEAGIAPRVLVRPRRAELLANGLRLTSPLGDWQGGVMMETDGQNCPAADIVIIACKAYDLDSALEAVAPAMTGNTILVPLLNGLRHIEQIKRRFPESTIWGGVAHIGVKVEPDGTICHFNQTNRFLMGPLPETTADPRVQQLVDALCTGPTEAMLRTDIQQDMWEKVVFLASLAGMTCLMRADVGAILRTDHGQALFFQMIAECTSIAKAAGHEPRQQSVDVYRANMSDLNSTSTASMLRDIFAGSQTEGEHIIGDLAARAAGFNLSVPLLLTCLTHLQAYENMRLKQ